MITGLEVGKVGALGLLAISGAFAMWPERPAGTTLILAQPVSTAIERLRGEQRLVEGTGMGSLTIAAAGMDGDALLVGVTRAGDPTTLTCRVAIAPASPDRSSAEIDCRQEQLEDRPLRRVGAKALELVVAEHVAATAENRAYDIDKVSTRLIALVVVERVAVAGAMQPPRD